MGHPTQTQLYNKILEVLDKLGEMDERCKCLEEHSHPPIPLECFEGFKELTERIDRLERINEEI